MIKIVRLRAKYVKMGNIIRCLIDECGSKHTFLHASSIQMPTWSGFASNIPLALQLDSIVSHIYFLIRFFSVRICHCALYEYWICVWIDVYANTIRELIVTSTHLARTITKDTHRMKYASISRSMTEVLNKNLSDWLVCGFHFAFGQIKIYFTANCSGWHDHIHKSRFLQNWKKNLPSMKQIDTIDTNMPIELLSCLCFCSWICLSRSRSG